MRKIHTKTIRGLAFSASALALTAGSQAYAQDADCPEGQEEVAGECVIQSDGPDGVTTNDPTAQDVVDVTDTGATGQSAPGAIVVTGSRIKRDTYSSISPLQVITSEVENEAGLFDPSQILQRSESASGQQIDATFQGFVLDNGPGSQTLNLRGLGADRTLLLLNGRRLAPAGVEGAPSSPSINLLPGSLIDRYDLLLDGASSIYGSDAVAGVGNVILRKDFDGLELFARGEINPQGAGEDYTISAAYGINFDRGFIGFGAEYDHRDTIRLRDRDFFAGCDTEYEITDSGEIRTVNVRNDAIIRSQTDGEIGVRQDPCKSFVGAAAIIVPGIYDSVLFFQDANGNVGVPGGNTGIPNFSVRSDAFGDFRDDNNDGILDVDYADYNVAGLNPGQTFQSGQDLYNVMAYGEYTFPGEMNLTPFFEANYTRAEITSDNNGAGNIAVYAPRDNAFNPCNFTINPNGVDCAAADNEFLGVTGTRFELPTGRDLAARSFFSIRGDRDNVEVTQEQYRGVIGLKGDLPFIAPSWTFEVAGVYSRSEGKSIRLGVREDKLAFALGVDPTADFNRDGIADRDGDGIADDYNGNASNPPLTGGACNADGLANPELAAPDLLQGCVPVNIFAPSVYGLPFGDFATQAERDYVFSPKLFDTVYEQKLVSAFVTGDLFELPAGPVGAVFGLEYRHDKIDSQADFVTTNGLFIQFASDAGTTGDKSTKEAFAEIDIPLQAGKEWVRELDLNLSGRITDDEFYGTNYTYAIKAGWRPIDPLLLKFSYGTSFRAPNLRENFLGGRTGFGSIVDPCAVPPEAYDSLGGGYNAENDEREQTTLENCRREGRDPTRVGISPLGTNSTQLASPEVFTGGTLDIDPETSRSITAGAAFEETFGDGFDVSLGINYYDIKVKDSIVSPSSQFIVNDCFTRQDGTRSPFCDRLTYDTDAENTRLLISDINSGFINLNQESVRGLDLNANFGKEVGLFGTLVDLGINLRANHLIERSNLFIGDNGDPSIDNDEGEFGFPKWTGRSTFTADVDKFRVTYAVRYTGPVEQQADGIDPLSDAFGRGPDGQPTGFDGNTCLGNGSGSNDPVTGEFIPDGIVAGDGVFCRDIGFADGQFLHSASVRYRAEKFTILVGVDNIFNTAPPLVDGNEVFAIANTAIGNGYDYDGREFFASITYEF
ncbi:TonB-dependent receptor [Qipengyuania sp. GH38]|uniref:TonB-dependent receptor domain-containing protein n=1 Tax=Qipengyuania intermedia TaxID=2867244 RepID=UPI001C88B226|nr:TonB-dependent receptor [Qipengyuania intermedia]MBX7514598.1 TonB-dependent receptor [Qipengyuania intermedia]